VVDARAIADFVNVRKTLTGGHLEWSARNNGRTFIAVVGVVVQGLEVGDLICRQIHGSARDWHFVLQLEGICVLERHYQPHGSLHSHYNRGERPSGFPRRDRSVIHDHPWMPPDGGNFSRPVLDADQDDHARAFRRLCRDVNIEPGDVHRNPPLPQISFPS